MGKTQDANSSVLAMPTRDSSCSDSSTSSSNRDSCTYDLGNIDERDNECCDTLAQPMPRLSRRQAIDSATVSTLVEALLTDSQPAASPRPRRMRRKCRDLMDEYEPE